MTCGWLGRVISIYSLPGRGRWDASFHRMIREDILSGTSRIICTEEFRRDGELASTHALKMSQMLRRQEELTGISLKSICMALDNMSWERRLILFLPLLFPALKPNSSGVWELGATCGRKKKQLWPTSPFISSQPTLDASKREGTIQY